MKTLVLLISLAVAGAGFGSAQAGVWHYGGKDGPSHWAQADANNSACGVGREQSPIDLGDRAVHLGQDRMALHWQPGLFHIVNNGHTIEAEAPPGSSVTVDGAVLPLRQVHFHLPSEHVLRGRHWAMEAHFVHQAQGGGRAVVVAVPMMAGTANPVFHAIMGAAGKLGSERALRINPAALLPAIAAHFRYEGSLTTPPCSEVVDWEVLANPVSVSGADIEKFRQLVGVNARPVQPVGRRFVLKVPG